MFTNSVGNGGADTGLDLFVFLQQGPPLHALVLGLAYVNHHGNAPVRGRVLGLNFFVLVHTPVIWFVNQIGFISGQQRVGLCHIECVCCRDHCAEYKAQVRIQPNMHFHYEVLLDTVLAQSATLGHVPTSCFLLVLGAAIRRVWNTTIFFGSMPSNVSVDVRAAGRQIFHAQQVNVMRMANVQYGALIGHVVFSKV